MAKNSLNMDYLLTEKSEVINFKVGNRSESICLNSNIPKCYNVEQSQEH